MWCNRIFLGQVRSSTSSISCVSNLLLIHLFICVSHSSIPCISCQFRFIMSLRSHLDRYCMSRAMAADPISTATRSRSPHADRQATSSRPSPFCRPPGWQPPLPQVHRPVILQIDLKPMRQLAIRDSYYNILAPQVTGNLSTSEYDGPFQIYKVTRSSTRTTPPDTILENLKHWSWIPSLNAGPFTSIPLISSLPSKLHKDTNSSINQTIVSWVSSTGTSPIGKPTNIVVLTQPEVLKLLTLTLPILVWAFVFRVFLVDIRSFPTML